MKELDEQKDILFWRFLREKDAFYASRLYNEERKKYYDKGFDDAKKLMQEKHEKAR